MTTVNFSRPARGAFRQPVRAAAVAATLAGALALTACGDGGGSDDGAPATPSATVSADTGGGTGGGTGGSASTSANGKLEGSWLATTNGKAVALVITGEQAALFATGGTVCSGTAGEKEGMQMIHLECSMGTKDRTTGMVDSVDEKSLGVTWESGAGQETFTKAEAGQLPTGLPTEGLGS